MKLHVMSDLHLEFHRDHGVSLIKTLDPKDVDALVIAGDIVSLRDHYWANDALSELCSLYKDVIYVQGNHEYYSTDIGAADHHLGAIEIGLKNLHVLRLGEPKVVQGKRFIGGTLWFRDSPANRHFQNQMNDFHVIKGGFDPWVYLQNAKTVANLKTHLQADDVVVSHHLPSQRSVHQKFSMSSLTRFFVCDLEQLILERRPKLWIHGHTHEGVDYNIGTTRVVANPHGYPREDLEKQFNWKLVIDV